MFRQNNFARAEKEKKKSARLCNNRTRPPAFVTIAGSATIVHGSVSEPSWEGGKGRFRDHDFWIAQCVSVQYLLVCKMKGSAFI